MKKQKTKTSMESQDLIRDLNSRVDEIVERDDSRSAGKLLQEIPSVSNGQNIDFKNQINFLAVKLKIVRFSKLSDQEAANIIKNYLLMFFRMDVSLEQSLIARYAFQGTTEKNNQRKILKEAVLLNREKLGTLTIGEWIRKFDQKYDIENRDEQDIVRFFLEDASVAGLNGQEKSVLKKIIYVYDTLLAGDILDIFDLIAAKERLEKGDIRQTQTGGEVYVTPGEDNFKNLRADNFKKDPRQVASQQEHKQESFIKSSLSDALKKLPNLGEQLITSAPLKLRVFPEAVRPSIKNWITDYYDALGKGTHGTIERGNYLFHSENGKRLTSMERRRLAEVLKSLDDGSELSIDTQNQRIIFGNEEKKGDIVGGQQVRPVSAPADFGKKEADSAADMWERYEAPKTQNVERGTQNVERKTWNPAENVRKRMAEEDKLFGISKITRSQNGQVSEPLGNVRFSSPQRLPMERKQEIQKPQVASPRPHTDEDLMAKIREANKQPSQPNNSRMAYKITPIGFVEKKENKMEYLSDDEGPKVKGNTVDLR